MNEQDSTGNLDFETPEEQIDSIYHELELARQWNRPSILIAVYNSTNVRKTAQDALEAQILKSGQDVTHYQIEYDDNLNLPAFIEEITIRKNSIFYIDPQDSEGKNSQIGQLIEMVNACKGYLVDHLVRVVFWLTGKEALSVAHQAPDFWASRHRVFEFFREQAIKETKSVVPAKSRPEPEVRKPMMKPKPANENPIPSESLLAFDLSEGNEPSISGINLLLMLGVSNWKDGNLEKACEPLKTALAIAEKSGNKTHQAMCQKAIALVKTDNGDIDEALSAYKQVVDLGQADTVVWNNIGSLSLKSGQFAEAQNAYKNALKAEPEDPVSWNGLGSAYAGSNQFEEAIGSYRKAIQFNSGFVTPWVGLADVLSRQNRNEDALYAYMRTIEMDKKNVHAWSEIGSIYFKAGSYEQAIDAYRKAMMLGDETETVVANLARAYSQAGYYPESVSLFQKVLGSDQNDGEKAELWNGLGDVYRRMNEYEKAVAAYEMADRLTTRVEEVLPAAEQNPKLDVDATEVSPEFHESLEQESEIISVRQASDPVNRENAKLWVRLGNTYLKAKAADRAISAFRKAIELDPANGELYNRLAELYKQRSDLDQAVLMYRKSVDILTDLKAKAASFSQIGELQREMKEYASALEAFETAIGLDPDNPEFISGLGKIQDDLDRLTGGATTQDADEVGKIEAPATTSLQQEPGVRLDESVVKKVDPEPMQVSENMAKLFESNNAKSEFPLNINLNNANVWNELGNIFTKSGSFDDAVNAYNRAIELNPGFGWSYCNLALVYARQGKGVEAVALYQKSIDLLWTEAEKAVAWNMLGDYYRQSGNYNGAIEAYQKADRLGHGTHNEVREQISEQQLFTHFVS